MADFSKYWNTLLKHEGGFVHHPNDPGGATNKGIILANWQRWGYDKNNDGIINVEDLKLMTDQEAFNIYKTHFWDKIYGDKIVSQPFAELLFDMYVNAPSVAIKMLQHLLNLINPDKPKLVVDGAMGLRTVSAINFSPAAVLHDSYKDLRKTYYTFRANLLDPANSWCSFFRSIGASPTDKAKSFIKGWLARVDSFPDLKKKV